MFPSIWFYLQEEQWSYHYSFIFRYTWISFLFKLFCFLRQSSPDCPQNYYIAKDKPWTLPHRECWICFLIHIFLKTQRLLKGMNTFSWRNISKFPSLDPRHFFSYSYCFRIQLWFSHSLVQYIKKSFCSQLIADTGFCYDLNLILLYRRSIGLFDCPNHNCPCETMYMILSSLLRGMFETLWFTVYDLG